MRRGSAARPAIAPPINYASREGRLRSYAGALVNCWALVWTHEKPA